MSRAQRGGHTLKTGKIGRVNCLRQQMLMPGERMNVGINGRVVLETLRERDSLRIHAHLATFLTPLRWLFSDWPQYVREGPDTLVTLPTFQEADMAKYGIGSSSATATGTYMKWYQDNVLRIHNEWYKHPEDTDLTAVDIDTTDGLKAVPLSTAWSRARYSATPDDTDDYTVSSATNFDVRELAEIQARFRGAMKRDVLSFNRWMELVDQTWRGSDPSREVDQVPIMLDQIEVGVNPREMAATDGASLGTWQSMFDFYVDHNINGIVAPEHCLVATMLTIRFAPIVESSMPLATNQPDWFEITGDPEYIAAAEPQLVQMRDLFDTTSSTTVGYLPAGWQWRCNHDVVGYRIDQRDSFPMMRTPTTQAECKDATRIVDAFRSQSLGDYLVDLHFNENSVQPIGDSMDSYFSGMVDDLENNPGGSGNEFPHGGKML